MQDRVFDSLWLTRQPQTTIRRPIWCKGIGVHSGVLCEVHLCPASIDTGVVFMLNNNGIATEIAASWLNSQSDSLRTTLVGNNGVQINTIEHLLAVYGIDNIEVKITANELPILDGSAADWMFLLGCVGVQHQHGDQDAIVIMHPVRVENKNGWMQVEPNNMLHVSYSIDYSHPLIGQDSLSFDVTKSIFNRELARARTFGFYKDAERMKKLGLALGSDLTNTVVFDNSDVINPGGLRWSNEPVRHKILDIIGDLYLAGAPIIGKVYGYCSGHALTHKLISTLMSTPTAWSWRSNCKLYS